MKANRFEVIEKLQNEIKENVFANRKLLEDIKDDLYTNNGLMKGDTQRLLRNDLHDIKDDSFIILIMESIFRYTKRDIMNPLTYFTEQEIQKAQKTNYTSDIAEHIDFPIQLDQVLQITEKDYVAVVKSSLLIAMSNSKKIYYNYDADHNTITIKRRYNDKLIKRINIIRKEVNKIYSMLSNNSYKHDPITLNVVVGTEENEPALVYDKMKRDLTINSVRIDIIDGYHLFEALKMKHLEDKDFDMNIQIALKWYTKDESYDYLEQEIR
jgi:hypothetical protein